MRLGKTKDGKDLTLDLDVLLKTRLLVTASSGGGKTGALFALCEQFAGKVQIIVLDPEGEFAPLRTKHPFLLVGPDGETPAMVRTAKLLATRVLELNASAICDIYELPVQQRHEFVRDFLDALVDAPKALWHPLIVIVDEGHVYGPEKGQGESVALQSMINIASRGRKRGYALVVATQRLAKLSKNVASELQNQLVGRTTQVDQVRAADVLNLSGKATRDDFFRMIGQMPTADFMAYGMAFGVPEPTRFTVSRPVTLPQGNHKGILVPPPAPASVKALLPKIADLPAEAEKKVKTEEQLREDIRNKDRRIRELESATPEEDPETIKMLKEKLDEVGAQVAELEAALESMREKMGKAREIAVQLADTLTPDEADKINSEYIAPVSRQLSRMLTPTKVAPKVAAKAPPVKREERAADGEGLTGPEQKIVDALAWFEKIGVETPEQTGVAFMAGYTIGGGAWNNPRGRLNKRGLVEYAGTGLRLTDEGRKVASYPSITPTSEALQEAVLERLPGPEGKLLRPLLARWPKGMTNEALADASGYTPGGGAFNNPKGRLRTLGLVEYRNSEIFARDILFPDR